MGAAVIDPKRHFGTLNCGNAKGSFDHLIGAGKKRGRDVEIQRLRGLSVDRQFVLGRRLHRQERLGD